MARHCATPDFYSMPYFRFYALPRSPLARLSLFIVGVVLGLALLAFGLVFGIALLAVALVGGVLRKLLGPRQAQSRAPAPPGVIEGEYVVVQRDVGGALAPTDPFRSSTSVGAEAPPTSP